MNKDALLSHWRDRITDKVLEAFNAVPREDFVLPEMKPRAYDDTPLPILRSKTISQPSTVILMTEALELRDDHHVLEIGTGSGYQAALLSKILTNGKVTTTEVIPELVTFARTNLKKISSENVTVYEHDGSQGYTENSPYDRIIFTAASPTVPLHLLDQLKEGGIMIVPVGDVKSQRMMKLTKHPNSIDQKNLGEFIFSPLVGKFGFNEEKL